MTSNHSTTTDVGKFTAAPSMSTLQFLQAILPSEGTHFLATMKAGIPGVTHHPFNTIEDMASAVDRLDKQPGVTVYHACASYREPFIQVGEKKQYRVAANTLSAKAFWVDLDCGAEKAATGKGYKTKNEAGKAILLDFCDKTGFPKPMIVSSGNGLHCYWPLTESIAPDDWKLIASQFKAALAHFGVLADPTRTADAASILRPPGSHNKKDPANPKPVKVLQETQAVDVGVIIAALSNILSKFVVALPVSVPVRGIAGDLNDDLTAHVYPDVPAYIDTIAANCNQTKQFKETGCQGNEPLWRAMIGALHLAVDGAAKIHAFSSVDPSYNQAETQRKIDSCIDKPTTCAHIESCNPVGCVGCPSKGKITTPLQLGRGASVTTQQGANTLQALVDEMNIRYTFIQNIHSIWDRIAQKFITRDQLRLTYANRFINVGSSEKPRMVTADIAWVSSPARSEHTHLDLDPSQPETMRNGALNTFRGFAFVAAPGDIGPFIEFFNHLIPEPNRGFVMTWFACAIQKLGERFHVALVIWTLNQGTGKSVLGETFGGLINSAHFAIAGQDAFTNQFNAWMRGCLLAIFEEVSAVKNRTGSDQIKTMLTATVRQVNGKYEPPFSEPNRMKAIFFSNHADAVALDDNDRRYYVVEGNSQRPSEELIARFIAWRDAGGQAALLHYLQNYDIGTFNPKAPAPATKAKWEMIADNHSDLERWVSQTLAAHDLTQLLGRELCSAEELTQRYTFMSGNKTSTRALSNVLRREGVPRLEKMARKADGSRVRCYALRNSVLYSGMTDAQLAVAMAVPFKVGGSR